MFHNWVWGEGTAWDFDNWNEDEPDPSLDYIKMVDGGGWTTIDCTSKVQDFVCQISPIKRKTTTKTTTTTAGTATTSTSSTTTITPTKNNNNKHNNHNNNNNNNNRSIR